jgi:hypothetical protein
MGGEKTITVQGIFSGVLLIEISNEGAGGPWAELTAFNGDGRVGKKTLQVAARFMRVRRQGSNTIIGGVPNVDVASNDNGGLFFDLPPGTPGAAIDVSAGGTFKTAVVDSLPSGSVAFIEISEDGVDWAECFAFAQDGFQSKLVSAQFMRVRAPIGTNVDIGAVNDATAMSAINFGPPITVRGPTNAEGVSLDAARADHDHRLEYEVEDEGVLVSARPRMDFVGDGVGAVDVPGEDLTRVTIPGPNLGDGGAVVKRSVYVGAHISTSSGTFVDGMGGSFVTVPIDGDYWVIFEGEGMNQAASGVVEIAISVNSTGITIGNSQRASQGPASDMRPLITTVQLLGLTAGDLIRCLFKKKSGAGSVEMDRRHLSIFKVQ